ncbi:MAG TPA: hypothetical protein VMF31_05960 [Solirubrobacterales bacterium]|nr:hypothetical protein [Solirubrobacterales bacterium]
MLRTTWKSLCLAFGLAVLMLCLTQAAQANLTETGSDPEPATARELGFTGTRMEIREQAAEIGLRGTWEPLDMKDYPAAMRAARSAPLRLEEPFQISDLESSVKPKVEPPRFPEKYVPRDIPGFGVGQMRSDGMIRALRPDGTFMYSPAEVPEDEAGAPTDGNALPEYEIPVQCKTSGRRIKLVYATPEGYTPTEVWEGLQPWTAMNRANAKIIVEALMSSHGNRWAAPYVDCYPPGHVLAGYPTISVVHVPKTEPSFSDISWQIDETLGRPSGVNAEVRLVFFATSHLGFGGLAQIEGGSSAAMRTLLASRQWNWRTRNAAVFRSSWMSKAVVHEMFHSLGAIPDANPRHWASTGLSHCLVEWDIMCYKDKGPYAHLYPLARLCDDLGPTGRPIDCLDDLYFRAHEGDPETLGGDPNSPNDWLDMHWNVIGAESKFFEVVPPWQYPDPCPAC